MATSSQRDWRGDDSRLVRVNQFEESKAFAAQILRQFNWPTSPKVLHFVPNVGMSRKQALSDVELNL